jgi:hypothetical protein
MNEEAKHLIDRISSISDNVKKDLKPLIQELAKNIGDNIDKAEIKNLAALEGIKDPEIKDVASIIDRLRRRYEWSFGKTTLYNYVQKEYKDGKVQEYTQPVRVNDNYIETHIDELKDKIRDYEKKNTPAKDIITKARLEDVEKYESWNCHMAGELAQLAIKMENEHNAKDDKRNHLCQHEDKLCKDYSKKIKMVRDSRFATDANSYDAILLGANSTQSLKNSISGEWEFKTVWEVKNDEDDCRECIHENCRHEKCKHECHRVVRPMTTKGLKYAIKTNEDLKELDKRIKYLVEINNDICRMGKMLLQNPKSKKQLGVAAIKRLMYAHIEKEECTQCDLFLTKNVTFLDDLE